MTIRLFLILFGITQFTQADQLLYLSLKEEKKIQRYTLNSQSGELTFIDHLIIDGGPGGLTLAPNGKHLYFSVSTEDSASLATVKIDAKGKLSFLGKTKIASGGSGTISKCGNFYVKYNYGRNTVALLEMKDNLHTGRQFQEITTTKNPHDIGISNEGNLVFVPHNGHNRLYQFRLDTQAGTLRPLAPPYLEGPRFEEKGFAAFRSLAFHPNQSVVYCTYEKGGGVASLAYDANGLRLWQEFSTREEDKRVLPTVAAVTPSGEFLYIPNRHGKKDGSSIAAFQLNPDSGEILNRIGIYNYPATGPRNIAIDHTGKFLFTSSVRTGTTFQFKIKNNGSLSLMKEHKIGSGSMVIAAE